MHAPKETTRSLPPSRGVFAGWILTAAAFLAYANSWQTPFVYDDTLAIPQNPSIRRLWPLTGVLLPPAEGGLTVSGRPVLNLSFAVNHAVSGTEAWSYHIVNTLIHAGAGLLLFGIVRRTLPRLPGAGRPGSGAAPATDTLALAIAALWTLHPLHTQAVTYTVQRAESLMGCFFLLTLYAFLRATTCHSIRDNVPNARAGPGHGMGDKRRGWYAVSVAACGLGMGTKEVMATAPLLVLLYDRTFVAGRLAGAWRARRTYYLALAATWLILGALVLSTGGNRGGTVGLGVGVPPWAYPLTQFKAVANYLALGVWPDPLVFEYGTFWVRRAGDVLPYAAVVLPLLVATAVALRRRPAAGFLGAWFFGILAPTSLAPGTIQMIVEHRMYLPLAALFAGLGWCLHRAVGPRLLAPCALVAVGLAVLTGCRNRDYRSPLALWSDTVAKRPLNPRAHAGLAEALAEAGRLHDAVNSRQEAVRLLPDESHYHFNLAAALAEAGRTDDAVRHYRLALRLTPGEPRTHNNLAILLVRLGRIAEALPHYAEAVRLNPTDALYHYNLGTALMRVERFAEAAAEFAAALQLRPDHADARFKLGNALLDAGRVADAIPQFEAALQLTPEDAEAHHNLGIAFARLERWNEARRAFDDALRLKPDYADAQRSREQLRQVTGR